MKKEEAIELCKEFIRLEEMEDIRKLNNLPDTNEDKQNKILTELSLDRYIEDFGRDATYDIIKDLILPMLEKVIEG